MQLSARRSEAKICIGISVGTQTVPRGESLTIIDKIAKSQCAVTSADFNEVEFIDKDETPLVDNPDKLLNMNNINCAIDNVDNDENADDVPL